jgi:hypothetical protein
MAVRAITLGLAALTLAAPMWRATLTSKDGSMIGGTVTVEAVGTDSSRATVQITGAKPGSALPWHIHNGACGAAGTVVGAAGAYPLLQVGKDGSAKQVVTLAFATPVSGAYSVNVHASASNMMPIACGALKYDGAMMKDSTTSMMSSDTTMHMMTTDTTTKP